MKFYKSLIFYSFFVLTIISCNNENKKGEAGPAKNQEGVFLDYPVKDLGPIPRDIPIKTMIVITNNKPDSIIMLPMSTTCDCMKVKLSKTHIPSHDTASIAITFDAHIPGFFDKDVYVNYVGQDSALIAKIKGHVKQ